MDKKTINTDQAKSQIISAGESFMEELRACNTPFARAACKRLAIMKSEEDEMMGHNAIDLLFTCLKAKGYKLEVGNEAMLDLLQLTEGKGKKMLEAVSRVVEFLEGKLPEASSDEEVNFAVIAIVVRLIDSNKIKKGKGYGRRE